MGVARKGQSGGYSQQIEKTRFQNKSGTRQWPYHCVIRCTFWDFWNSFFFFVTLSLLNLAESFFFWEEWNCIKRGQEIYHDNPLV